MKIKYISHKFIYLFLPVLLLFSAFFSCFTAFASQGGMPDLTKSGSLTLTLMSEGTAVTGAEVTIYKAVDIKAKGNNLAYIYTKDFADFGGSPEELNGGDATEKLAEFVKNKKITGKSATTDGKGALCFKGLSPGVYLIVQTGSVKGYSDFTPFVVSTPSGNKGKWVYDIHATPKVEISGTVDISVKKVWNDNGENRPKNITVRLLKDKTVVESVLLNEKNGWSYKWTNMEKGENWSVSEAVPKAYTVTYSKKGLDFTITNTSPLIQTGQLNWPVPVLTIAGILLFASGWILYHKGKRHSA